MSASLTFYRSSMTRVGPNCIVTVLILAFIGCKGAPGPRAIQPEDAEGLLVIEFGAGGQEHGSTLPGSIEIGFGIGELRYAEQEDDGRFHLRDRRIRAGRFIAIGGDGLSPVLTQVPVRAKDGGFKLRVQSAPARTVTMECGPEFFSTASPSVEVFLYPLWQASGVVDPLWLLGRSSVPVDGPSKEVKLGAIPRQAYGYAVLSEPSSRVLASGVIRPDQRELRVLPGEGISEVFVRLPGIPEELPEINIARIAGSFQDWSYPRTHVEWQDDRTALIQAVSVGRWAMEIEGLTVTRPSFGMELFIADPGKYYWDIGSHSLAGARKSVVLNGVDGGTLREESEILIVDSADTAQPQSSIGYEVVSSSGGRVEVNRPHTGSILIGYLSGQLVAPIWVYLDESNEIAVLPRSSTDKKGHSVELTLPIGSFAHPGRLHVLEFRDPGSREVFGNREVVALPSGSLLVRSTFDGKWRILERNAAGDVVFSVLIMRPGLPHGSVEVALLEEPLRLVPTGDWKVVWSDLIEL